jgi:hypothetical protein
MQHICVTEEIPLPFFLSNDQLADAKYNAFAASF